ncbi:MAG TPA: dienelactone hydrolase family protein [Chloroflexota bacterium]|nr:dienelactone hydrolase family protein [Chloroflexota bacterium]
MTSEQSSYRVVRLYLENGSILAHEFAAPGSVHGVIWLGSARGGLDSPARDLFDHLATNLTRQGITSLRLRYRTPEDLDHCVEDALVGIQFLTQNGIQGVVLVGYSQGGAVAIEAGASAPDAVIGIAVVASQSFGTGAVNRLAPRPILIVQGENDQVVPADCANYIYDKAQEPKQLVVIPGADHTFNTSATELGNVLESFVQECFRGKQANAA